MKVKYENYKYMTQVYLLVKVTFAMMDHKFFNISINF